MSEKLRVGILGGTGMVGQRFITHRQARKKSGGGICR